MLMMYYIALWKKNTYCEVCISWKAYVCVSKLCHICSMAQYHNPYGTNWDWELSALEETIENRQHWEGNYVFRAPKQNLQKYKDIQKYTYHYPWCTNWALSSQWEKERESLKRLFPTCFSWFWEKYVPINSIKREHIWTSQLIWLKVLFLFKPIRI